MIRPNGSQIQTGSDIDFILQNALNNIITLEESPTTAGGQLQEGFVGRFGTGLFVTLGGTTYKIATMVAQ